MNTDLNGPDKMWVPAETLAVVSAAMNAELAAARESNMALRGALAELLAISEDPDLDLTPDFDRIEAAQAKAREALLESVGL